MFPRKQVPYDRSETMPGFDIPQPGGGMKKMSFEFADAQEQAAQAQQPQIPQGAGVPPAGMQPIMPAGMQGAAPQGAQPDASGSLFASLAGGADQFGQGPDSGMFTDEQLMSMVGDEDPAEMMGADMHESMMDPSLPPEIQQQLQMSMMEAARRRMGGL